MGEHKKFFCHGGGWGWMGLTVACGVTRRTVCIRFDLAISFGIDKSVDYGLELGRSLLVSCLGVFGWC